MNISGVVKGQYKQECPNSWEKCNGNESLLEYKIKRAVELGKVAHTYKNGAKIVRYHSKNFLIDDSEIMTMWTDKNTKPVAVSEEMKDFHKYIFYTNKKLYNKLMVRMSEGKMDDMVK